MGSRGLKTKSQLLLAIQCHLRKHFQGRSGMKDMQITGAKTNNKNLLDWIETTAHLSKPDSIHICDGSQEEYDDLCNQMVESGTFIRLNEEKRPNSFLCRSL
jgi:phosphoenolpyruvate carboxykinase (GTP)